MNRITGQDASAPEAREVLQVTLDGEEILAAHGLVCMAFQFLGFTLAANEGRAAKAQERLQAASEIADKIVSCLSPQTVKRVHAKFHPQEPDAREN